MVASQYRTQGLYTHGLLKEGEIVDDKPRTRGISPGHGMGRLECSLEFQSEFGGGFEGGRTAVGGTLGMGAGPGPGTQQDDRSLTEINS
jgi:hypothetical protein